MTRSARSVVRALLGAVAAATLAAPAIGQLEGTIYFDINARGGERWSMDANGNNKTLLPAFVYGEPSHGEPSHALHAGARWWLQVRETRTVGPPVFTGTGLDDLQTLGAPGEPLPTEDWSVTYFIEIDGTGTPDTFQWWAVSSFAGTSPTTTGVPIGEWNELVLAGFDTARQIEFASTTGHTVGDRWDVLVDRPQPPSLYAVRQDGGAEALLFDPLTNQIGMAPSSAPARWATGGGAQDAVVSWQAVRYDLGAGQVVESGISVRDVVYDGNGNVTGLATQPATPRVPGEAGTPDVEWQDWSPDGASIVFSTKGGTRGEALWIADSTTGQETLLTTNVFQPKPAWSTDGSRIAYRSCDPRGISTIAPDGSGEDLVLWGNGVTRVLNPRWSPTGSHLIYSRDSTSLSGDRDVYRATDAGKQKKNLTPDTVDWAIPGAWRADGGGTPTPPAAPSGLGAGAAASRSSTASPTTRRADAGETSTCT